ncbi:hypothetical protein M501DRAFT_1030227 [Patellaria atrata CBS 101060]|uniref:FAD-binding FR-type domain-containing protein n=1 Tax=Patellaria atrata CBS 101060 TaxID=1346257 RepID=A0A9P4SEP1_9PEZI|nr:hypothetical protein M501DRAFT_1030227 [Patellaria atrata CBS 101060]
MRSLLAICLLGSSIPLATAFVGLGKMMYKPSCAYACRAAIESATLSCSEEGHSHGGHMGHGGGMMTTPECRAGDTPFLTTLAYCINSTCEEFDVDFWKLEKYWHDKTTGDVAAVPKWTYGEAVLEAGRNPPETEWDGESTLNFTALVPKESWIAQKMTLEYFEEQETLHARYGVVLLVTGFAIPIVFTLINYLPFMTALLERLSPYIIYPSLIGNYHVRPLPYLLGNAPTIGQSLYIFFFFSLNILLSAVEYRSTQPNTWFATRWQEIAGYVSCRTGVLAFALAPLVILFAGRNNFLLWVTNWSHSTFMLLHRWVARIFGLQVIVHSIVELALYIDNGSFKEETVQPYWIWGIVGTLACSIMLIASMLYFRRLSYEVFLLIHILLAVFVLVGSWYHVDFLFENRWGYKYWLYAAFAVWAFDRILRLLRIAKTGIKTAKVTDVGDGIVRIDIPGVRWATVPGRHAYAYFPAISGWRPWENHPFSIIPSAMLHPSATSPVTAPNTNAATATSSAPSSVSETSDPEKALPHTHTKPLSSPHRPASPTPASGVTLYIRKSTGTTQHLVDSTRMTAVLDGPYPNSDTAAVLSCDRLILIGGGIGITALLPFLGAHANAKLYWSVRAAGAGLVQELASALEGREKEVVVGSRLDVEGVLAVEAQGGWERIGVVVCGPGGLCDGVRDAVARAGRKGRPTWELEVEAYSW